VKKAPEKERGARRAVPLRGNLGNYTLLVDVVQTTGLQTHDLQENQIKETIETAQWQFGRPFLGQNTGGSMQPAMPGV
jgi:hypothetical protein